MIAVILTFASYFLLDIAWALWAIAIAKQDATRAALWAGSMPVLVGLATLQYVNDPWMLIPAALGGAAGTFVAVRLK